jgi:hypothetical protein
MALDAACVFMDGAFLPRDGAPCLPGRVALGEHPLSMQTGLCHTHEEVRPHYCHLEMDNYGNLLLFSSPPPGAPPCARQHPVYFARSTARLPEEMEGLAVLALKSCFHTVASVPAVRANIICDDSYRVVCAAGHADECPRQPPCPGRGPCSRPYLTSSFPYGSRARMFAARPDELSKEQHDGAVQLCLILSAHFNRALSTYDAALQTTRRAIVDRLPPVNEPLRDALQKLEWLQCALTASHLQLQTLKDHYAHTERCTSRFVAAISTEIDVANDAGKCVKNIRSLIASFV